MRFALLGIVLLVTVGIHAEELDHKKFLGCHQDRSNKKSIDNNHAFGIPQCRPLIKADTILTLPTCKCEFPDSDPEAANLNLCPHPESIIYGKDRNLYVTLTYRAQILKVEPNGKNPKIYASLPHPANNLKTGEFSQLTGLVQNDDGDIFVCYADSRGEVNGIWKVFADKTLGNGQHKVKRIFSLPVNLKPTPAANFANGITLDKENLFLYVTDSANGFIYRIDSERINTGSTWSTDPLLQGNPTTLQLHGNPVGANGIDIDDRHSDKFLYVTVTASGGTIPTADAKGRLIRIPINADGSAGPAQLLFEDKILFGSDGGFFDPDQRIFYWGNSGSDTPVYALPAVLAVAVDQQPTQVKIIWTGSPAFGCSSVTLGRGRDKNKLYGCNLDFVRLFSVFPSPFCLSNSNESPGNPGIIRFTRIAPD